MIPTLTAAAPAAAEPKRVQPTCSSCRFYRSHHSSSGLCRLLPPVLTQPDEAGPFGWEQPQVYAAGWCGQWQPREAGE